MYSLALMRYIDGQLSNVRERNAAPSEEVMPEVKQRPVAACRNTSHWSNTQMSEVLPHPSSRKDGTSPDCVHTIHVKEHYRHQGRNDFIGRFDPKSEGDILKPPTHLT